MEPLPQTLPVGSARPEALLPDMNQLKAVLEGLKKQGKEDPAAKAARETLKMIEKLEELSRQLPSSARGTVIEHLNRLAEIMDPMKWTRHGTSIEEILGQWSRQADVLITDLQLSPGNYTTLSHRENAPTFQTTRAALAQAGQSKGMSTKTKEASEALTALEEMAQADIRQVDF